MSLLELTKDLMGEYITKTNEIYASTVNISNDVNTFNNSSILDDLDALKSSVDTLKSTVGALTAPTQSDIDGILAEIGTISASIQTATDQITALQDGYTVVETTVSGLGGSIGEWIRKSSYIFSETVKLLEKAKQEGCN